MLKWRRIQAVVGKLGGRELPPAQGVVYHARHRLSGQVVDTEHRHSPCNHWALAGWTPG